MGLRELRVKYKCEGVHVKVKGSRARERPLNVPRTIATLWIRRGGLRVVLRVERRCVVRNMERTRISRDSALVCVSLFRLGLEALSLAAVLGPPARLLSTLAICRNPPQGEKHGFMQMMRATGYSLHQ